MQPSLYYGMCGTDTEATIGFFRDAEIRHLTCGADQVPGRKEKGVLTGEDLRVFKAPFEEAGIHLSVVTLRWMKRAPDGTVSQEALDRLCAEIAVLGGEGVPTAQLFETGKVPADADRGGYLEGMYATYRRIVAACADSNVELAIHSGWVPECALWDTESHLALFEAVPDPHNGVCFCAGSYYQSGDDLAEAVRLLGDRIHFVHFRDAQGTGGRCENILLGSGRVPFRRAAEALREVGYEGLVHCEHFGEFSCQRSGEASAAWGAGFMRALFGLD